MADFDDWKKSNLRTLKREFFMVRLESFIEAHKDEFETYCEKEWRVLNEN